MVERDLASRAHLRHMHAHRARDDARARDAVADAAVADAEGHGTERAPDAGADANPGGAERAPGSVADGRAGSGAHIRVDSGAQRCADGQRWHERRRPPRRGGAWFRVRRRCGARRRRVARTPRVMATTKTEAEGMACWSSRALPACRAARSNIGAPTDLQSTTAKRAHTVQKWQGPRCVVHVPRRPVQRGGAGNRWPFIRRRDRRGGLPGSGNGMSTSAKPMFPAASGCVCFGAPQKHENVLRKVLSHIAAHFFVCHRPTPPITPSFFP